MNLTKLQYSEFGAAGVQGVGALDALCTSVVRQRHGIAMSNGVPTLRRLSGDEQLR